MAFSAAILREALEKVNERKRAAEKLYEKRLGELYAATPELSEIDSELKIKSSQMALAVLSGNTASAEQLRATTSSLNADKKRIFELAGFIDRPVYTCTHCGDTGYSDGKLCDCVRETASKLCYAALLSDMPIKNSTFQSFKLDYYSEERNETGISPRLQMAAALKTCQNFADNFPEGKNLFLTGKSGLGKTHLSLAIANVVLSKGYSVIYGSAQNLINEVSRETFDRSGSTDKIDSLNSCDLLILDDLGTEFSTSLSTSVVYNIINTRLMRGLSTVISTNLGFENIKDTYSERIASRIIGSYSILPCFGSDIRIIKAKNNIGK